MKRYYYQGKEISKTTADLMCYGAFAGIIASGFGVYYLMILMLSL